MDAEQYQRAYALFMKTVDLDDAARAAALDEACADAPELRAWVEGLIAEEEGEGDEALETAFAALITDSMGGPSRADALRPGAVVGRFEVVERLGAGGSAAVWKVRHRSLRSLHALKVLLHVSSEVVERFRREGQLQGRIRHRNVVAISDLIDVMGQPGLVMEFVEGPDLRRYLAAHAPSPEQLDALAAGVFEGVEAIHRAGLVHRDLKPANILLSQEGDALIPKVGDFGIARWTDSASSLTRTGALMGTLHYMAPEQIRRVREADHRADIWALGCVLYRMACGQDAFTGDDGEVLSAILAGERRATPPQLPERWRAAIDAALSIDPAARPQSCAALRDLWMGQARAPSAPPAAREAPEEDPTRQTSLSEGRSKLPAPRSRFFGRAEALRDLQARLAQGERLISVLGVGGLGKSRLCVELGHASVRDFPGGVYFIPLAEARTREDILSATARALGVPLGMHPQEQLTHALRHRGRMLLILDNFEQLVAHAASTLGPWLDAAPELALLVTSREPLRLQSELCYTLQPLQEREATALFVARATKANPRLRPDTDTRAAIAELVRLLDHLPLAIELAAGRSRLLSPERLLARMSQRFELLKSRSPELPPRQRTLRAALEWSWELLNPTERAALAQCSAFEGGMSLRAAEAVLSVEGDAWVEDTLLELVEKSLLQSDPDSGRLSMLMSVQQLAAEHLAERDPVLERHGAFFATLDASPLSALQAELENLRVACHRAMARADHEVAVACALLASEVYLQQGPFQEGAALVEQVLSDPTLSDAQRAPLELRACALWSGLGDWRRALQWVEAAQRSAHALEDPVAGQRALGLRARAHYWRGEVEEARACLAEAIEAAERLGERNDEARWRSEMGQLEAIHGAPERAEAQYRLALQRAAPAERPAILGRMGTLSRRRGQLELAERTYKEAIAAARALGQAATVGAYTRQLGYLYRQRGLIDQAIAHYTTAIRVAIQSGSPHEEATCLGQLGEAYQTRGELEPALAHYHDALRIFEQLHDARSVTTWAGNVANIYLKQGRLAEAQRGYHRALKSARQLGDRRLEALWLGNLGALLYQQGDLRGCLEHLRSALSISRALEDLRRCVLWLTNLGFLSLQLGQLSDAERHLTEARAISAKAGLPALADVLSKLGALAQARGAFEDAARLHDEAVKLARQTQDLNIVRITLAGRGQLHERLGRRMEAEADTREALDVARQLQAPSDEALMLGQLAGVLAARGQVEEARASLEEAEATFGPLRGSIDFVQLLRWRAQVAHHAGDSAAAERACQEAEARLMVMGAGPDAPILQALQHLRAARADTSTSPSSSD